MDEDTGLNPAGCKRLRSSILLLIARARQEKSKEIANALED
jgi:hypothetical protein